MKKLVYLACTLAVLFVASCKDTKTGNDENPEDSTVIADTDTTLYGTCGEGTSMHSIELVTDDGKTMTLMLDADADEDPVKGGLSGGDRLAIVTAVHDGDTIAQSVINLTSLLGKWTSLDRNFEIAQDGKVISSVKSESDPYTSWKIHNGRLLMGRDTFDIIMLGADSLELDNGKGRLAYKRQK